MAQDTAADIRMESDIFFLTLTLITGKNYVQHMVVANTGALSNLRTVKGYGCRCQFFHILWQNLKSQGTAGAFSCHGLKYAGSHAGIRAFYNRQRCRILFAIEAAYLYTVRFSFVYTCFC